MTLARLGRVASGVLGATASFLGAWSPAPAKRPPSFRPARLPRIGPPTADAPSVSGVTGGTVVVAPFLLAFIAVMVGFAVKVSSRRHIGIDEAAALQARIADALRADPALGSLPVVATAGTPRWSRSSVRIELSGVVPSPALREAAISLAIREAFQSGLSFSVADRLRVDAATTRFVA